MVSTSIAIKRLLAMIYDKFGLIENRCKTLSRDHFVILMYHRIIPKEKVDWKVQSGMYVDPVTFDIHMQYLKDNYEILPLNEVLNLNHIIAKNNKMSVFLTFDDAWRDNYEYAFPLLEKYKIPATIFLPTGYIGTDRMFWTDQIALLLDKYLTMKNKDKYCNKYDEMHENIINVRRRLNNHYETCLSILKNKSEEDITKLISELSSCCKVNCKTGRSNHLSIDELRIMQRSKVIYYGSHTVSHKILTNLNIVAIKYELEESKQWLLKNELVDAEFIPFSYPNGNYNSLIEKLVIDAGYHLAVSTDKKLNTISTDRFKLGRINIHEDMTSNKSMYAMKIAGIN